MKLFHTNHLVYGADLPVHKPRYLVFLIFMQDPKSRHKYSNIYSRTLQFVPVLDVYEQKLAHMERCPTGDSSDDDEGIKYNTR